MKEELLNKLPLGTSAFGPLRKNEQVYVDKTDYIYKLASNRGKFFLARPRRFGKSLLVSTFESLFTYGLRDFAGLKIEKLWKDPESYQVVRLDFSRIKPNGSFEEFQAYCEDYLSTQFQKIGFRRNQKNIFSNQLDFFISRLPDSSLVVLIDEYDAPLTACLDKPELFRSIRNYFSTFYSIFKANDAALRFLFITGITKFNKTSIFSELNNLTDISLLSGYGALLGYTHQEVEKYFYDYLSYASQKLQISREELSDRLTENYDGFCFEETAKQRVFSPWSLLMFLTYPERGFKDYWFESGGKPSVLLKYFKSHSLRNPEEYGKEKTLALSSLSSSSDIENLSDVGLLTQAGYLTIKAVKYGDTVFVGYPNKEVKKAIAQLYVEQLLNGRIAGQVGAGPIVEVLSEEGAESVFHILNRLFHAIDYSRYPVKDEASVRAFVQVYFSGAGLDPVIEHHTAHGRTDLEVKAGTRHWIFEFKVARPDESAKIKLSEALEQIKSRNYGADSTYCEVRRIALVFSIGKREFVEWQEC